MSQNTFPHIKVYVGCALTYASEEFKQDVEKFKDVLRTHCTVLDFLGLDDTTPNGVYQHDIHNCVMQCHLLIAIADYPSTGLGYEIGTQCEKRGAPILAVAHTDALVTDLILDTQQRGFEFKRYKTLVQDVIPLTLERLQAIDLLLKAA